MLTSINTRIQEQLPFLVKLTQYRESYSSDIIFFEILAEVKFQHTFHSFKQIQSNLTHLLKSLFKTCVASNTHLDFILLVNSCTHCCLEVNFFPAGICTQVLLGNKMLSIFSNLLIEKILKCFIINVQQPKVGSKRPHRACVLKTKLVCLHDDRESVIGLSIILSIL